MRGGGFPGVFLLLAGLAGCGGGSVQHVTGVEARISQEGSAFGRYAPQDQQLIRSGRVRPGLDERAMWIAHGTPAFFWQSNIGGKWCRVFAYGVSSSDAVDTAIYACDGMIRYVTGVRPELPCWRVVDAGRRAVERADHFDQLPLGEQWALLAGILRRGQSTQDIYVAFGAPYNTGAEAREDGTNAAQQVFLDRAEDAYSLYVTFVADQVVAWRFPPERTLTPEAQQRRLDAMENRLMDQLQQMEAESIRQHQEQMAVLGNIQAQQEQMIDTLATQASAGIEANTAAQPGGVPVVEGGGGALPPGTGVQSTFQDGGCVYTDLGDGQMGRACSGDPDCTPGYRCTSLNGAPGRCLPRPECPGSRRVPVDDPCFERCHQAEDAAEQQCSAMARQCVSGCRNEPACVAQCRSRIAQCESQREAQHEQCVSACR